MPTEMIKPGHEELELIPKKTCDHVGTAYKTWSRGSSTVDWGRRKFREIALWERTFHVTHLRHATKETRRHYRLVESEKRFENLVRQWHDETWHLSSPTR